MLLLFKMPSALSFMSPASCCLAEPNQLTPHLAPPCMSPTHHVMMSPCRCHHVTNSQCHHVTVSQCRNVTMSPCRWRPAVLQSRAIAFLDSSTCSYSCVLLSCRTPFPIASLHYLLGVTSSPSSGFDKTSLSSSKYGWESLHICRKIGHF